MDKVQLGRASVARVVEFQFSLGTRFFPRTPASGWHDNADLLVPDFHDPDKDEWRIAVQSWVIEVDGLTVVVDTGVGNDRERPHMPALDHLDTGYLHALQSAGVDRNAVDVVVNTHIHSDHVGWNTMLAEGAWIPTFPNARYVLPAADYQHFQPDGPAATRDAAHRGRSGTTARRPVGVRRQRDARPEGRPVSPVVGRLSDQRLAAPAARRRAHTGFLGAVAGCG